LFMKRMVINFNLIAQRSGGSLKEIDIDFEENLKFTKLVS
jgi:hypothetical protein